MWTVVYIAANREAAEAMKEALGREGILAIIRPVGFNAAGTGNFEVLVSEAEAEEAHELVSTAIRDYPE